jgi:hypothetical protein
MEKLHFSVWKHPDHGIFGLPWHLSKEYASIEDRMHGKVRVLRGGIKVLECFPQFLNDLQPLRTFFRDFSHQGLLGSFSAFNASSG